MRKNLVTFVVMISMFISFNSYSQGKFSALFFGDYFYNVQRDTFSSTLNNAVLNDKKDLNGFIYRRIYLTYSYKFNSRVTSVINLESDQKSNTSNGKFGFFLKNAFIKWDSVLSNMSFSFGLISTQTFSISEKWWGHRYLEKTITDLRKIQSSRDFGLAINGSFVNDKIFYKFMLGNNSGNKPEINRFKSIYGLIGFNPNKNLIFTLSYTHHFLQKSINTFDSTATSYLNRDKSLVTFFAGYKIKDKFSTGIECFYQTLNNMYNTGSTFSTYHALGGTFYIDFYLNKKLSLTGRIDYFEPNDHEKATEDRRFYYIASVNYNVNKNVYISPNILMETYDKISGKNIKPGITPRITFYWKY